jgi:hypothetical protein
LRSEAGLQMAADIRSNGSSAVESLAKEMELL